MQKKNISQHSQLVVELYKCIRYPEMVTWSEELVKIWDKENFARYKKSAELFMKLCGNDVEYALGMVEHSKVFMEIKGFEWTFETIIKRFPDIKIEYDKRIQSAKNIEDEKNKKKLEQDKSEEDRVQISPEQFENLKKELKKMAAEKDMPKEEDNGSPKT